MEAGPGRECGIGAPGTQDIQGDFGVGKETVPEVVRKVRVSGREDGVRQGGFCLSVLPSLQARVGSVSL